MSFSLEVRCWFLMKLIVVDGYSLAFRAFFAIPVETMVTTTGQHTNALYGFLSMLDGLLEDFKPTHMAVALDRQEPTFRDEVNSDYKSHRPETHPGLKTQLELLERAVAALGITVVSKARYEADDVLATLAELGKSHSVETILVTGDRDSFQLVHDPYVKVLYNRRGVSDYLMLDEAGVLAKVEAEPQVYPFLAALRGDPSDNLFGVPGVGAKTAAKLAMTYRDLDGLVENLDALSPRLATSIGENLERVKLNIEMTNLIRNLDLGIELSDLELTQLDESRAKEFFDFLESKKLLMRTIEAFKYLGSQSVPYDANDQDIAVEVENRLTLTLDEFCYGLSNKDGRVAVEVEYLGESGRSPINAIAMARGSDDGLVLSYFMNIEPEHERLQILALFEPLGSATFIGFNLKEFLRRCYSLQIEPVCTIIDIGLGAYLVDASLGAYDQWSVIRHFRPSSTRSIQRVHETASHVSDLFSTSLGRSNTELLAIVHEDLFVASKILEKLKEAEMTWLFESVELELLVVLAKMEAYGIAVDREYLTKLKDEFISQAKAGSNEIQAMAGRSFNVNSTKQLGEVLFVDLGLIPPKKTKTGFSTDAQSLEKLLGTHPIIASIVRYREVEKLRSTYGESLIAEIAPDGRIHASFNQMVARTGRLSSDHPNLHNIPIRTTEGKKFRYAFVAPAGFDLVVADYSQIELRVIAHLSHDKGLIDAFTAGTDIHTQTAAAVFGIELNDVTPQQRSKAKMVAYGLAYGMEAYGLAMRLNVEVPEADAILKGFFAAFPSVRAYMDQVIKDATKTGYTLTEFGRRRRIPDLNDPNFRIRQAAERQAMNAGIQGLAADIFKLALVKLNSALDPAVARIVLQVHDEVIVEVSETQSKEICQVVERTLENAVDLRVPLLVNSYVVKRWGDAK